jgi:steroid delta-isomerase-like uncharacterized protein
MGSARRSITVLLFAALLASAVGCQREATGMAGTRTDRNKALVRRWIEEGFNKRQLSVVDELFAEHVAVNGQAIGRDGLKQSMRRHLSGFPDLHVTINDILAEENDVGIWYTVEGTHQGEFETIPPTGKHVRWVGFDLVRLNGGKIFEARFLSDFFGLLTQLGARVTLPSDRDVARP